MRLERVPAGNAPLVGGETTPKRNRPVAPGAQVAPQNAIGGLRAPKGRAPSQNALGAPACPPTPSLPLSPRCTPPRPYRAAQRLALPYLRQTQHPALLMEMRLGKTLLVVRRLAHLQSATFGSAKADGAPDGGCVKLPCLGAAAVVKLNVREAPEFIHGESSPGPHLVVAPNSALGAWLVELRAEGVPEGSIALLSGPRKRRLALLGEKRPWNLINWEGHRALPEIGKWPWGAVVCDESTAIKSPTAQVTKFFLQNFRAVPHRFILTGTINPESDLDIWCQLAFLDGHAWGCRTYWAARARYFKPSITGYGLVPRRGAQSMIRRQLAARAFILRRKDCGADTPKVYQRRRLELPGKWRKVYDQIEEEFALPAPENGAAGPAKETKYAAARYHWLRQLCGGYLDGALVWPGKLHELAYLLANDLRGEPLVVWFYYNSELKGARDFFTARKYSVTTLYGTLPPKRRLAEEARWQRGETQLLFVQQAIAAKGANFSRADTCAYYSTPLGALARQQTEDRIVDINRKTTTLILDLVVPGTVDEDAVDLAQDKQLRGAWTLERARALAMRRRGVGA